MLFYEIDSLRVISNGIYLETVHSAREVSREIVLTIQQWLTAMKLTIEQEKFDMLIY